MWKRLIIGLVVACLVIGGLLGIGLVGYVYLAPLPEFPNGEGARIIDVNEELITVLTRENRTLVRLHHIPLDLQEAFIAVEDSRFYTHHGLDLRGIGRAFWVNLQAERIVQGGSTITQQLAKNLFLGPERTLVRKIREGIYTLQLERHFTKNEILETYLNHIYFGHGAYGVEAASQVYFGKPVTELTLGESAMLAGIPRGPAIYSPYRNLEAAKNRQAVVLASMAEQGYITLLEAEQAKAKPIRLVGLRSGAPVGSYFIQHVVRELAQILPGGEEAIYNQGLTIKTTMDLSIQRKAEEMLKGGLPQGEKDERGINQPQGALIAIDPENGQVRALVGGRDYEETEYNRATQSKRQPGSAFKPFLYATALGNGYTLADHVTCDPKTYETGAGPYTPKDHGTAGYHYGDLTLRRAIRESCNVIAVELNHRLGPASTVNTANKMGIQSPLQDNLSLPLGTSELSPLELAAAYVPLANGGYRIEPQFYLDVRDKRGAVIVRTRPPRRERALDERVAYLLTDALREPLRPGGTAQVAGGLIGRPAAGKTGTTQDNRDSWFAGYTPDLVTVVYAGYDYREKPVGGGGSLAAPIWARFTSAALANVPARDFPRPSGVVTASLCTESGQLAGGYCPGSYEEVFIQGTAPVIRCTVHTPGNWWEELLRIGERTDLDELWWWPGNRGNSNKGKGKEKR